MAIAGNSAYVPAVRVCIRNRGLKLCPPIHNVPKQVLWMPEQAAAHFIDNPKAYIYVPTSDHGGTVYLAELLQELDMIDPAKPASYDRRGEPYHYYPEGSDTPKLCEVSNGWVSMFDTERVRHISKFAGRFVKLVEAHDD